MSDFGWGKYYAAQEEVTSGDVATVDARLGVEDEPPYASFEDAYQAGYDAAMAEEEEDEPEVDEEEEPNCDQAFEDDYEDDDISYESGYQAGYDAACRMYNEID